MPITTKGTAANRARLIAGLASAVLLAQNAAAIPTDVSLGSACGFAVLAGSGITVAGAVNSTTITGDIGTHPTPSITGLGNVVLNGANQADNAVTMNAKGDLTTAYNDAAGRTYDATYAGGFDLVGLTLPSGVYNDSSSLFLSGTVTLDAQGNPDAVWIFQAGSSLITASDSAVALIGGAQACHVFWQVGSSATLGTGTEFAGNIMALQSITLNTGATMDGRALALNGAVTLDNNVITRAVCIAGGNTGGTPTGETPPGGTGGTPTGGTPTPDAGSTLALALIGFGGVLLLRGKQDVRA